MSWSRSGGSSSPPSCGTSSSGARAGGSRCGMCAKRSCPAAFFGLNLAIFFAGATHNSVANAALIGSLAPFLIVPIGAMALQRVQRSASTVLRARSRSGVSASCCSAHPPNGDASLRGNVFGFLAMLLWSWPTWSSTRRFRQDMDVAMFMATICPIAAVAVLPLAVVNGDVFGMSGTGWTYMLILTFLSGSRQRADGVRAEDDPDRHDRDRPGGATRARSGVVVPVAGRDPARWQFVGIAIAIGGLLRSS